MTRKNDESRTLKPFPWRCPSCAQVTLTPTEIAHRSEIKYESRLHVVEIACLAVLKCTNCGEVIYTNDSDDAIADALRQQLGLLTPREIKECRETLGLTQRELAAHLGTAEETISRWEGGLLIQSHAMDNLLRLYFNVPAARTMLAGAHVRFGTA
jgi:putative zinc finger/helix-turn-helix YgiT family protein